MNPRPLKYSSIGVVGAGAWGTALAALVANNGADTRLWAREKRVVQAITQTGINHDFLPDILLPKIITPTNNLADLAPVDAIIFVVPSQFARAALADLNEIAPAGKPVALCSKGIEQTTGKLMTGVLSEVWPAASAAVLSGPSFAKDVASKLPTAVTLAAARREDGDRWVASIGAPHFRPYLSDDLVGAELGGAIKNVLAIAAGAVIGLGYGESARAALIARGFNEFQRLGLALGARTETMAGLSGLGDLILTANSLQSRNASLGVALGQGQTLDEIMQNRKSVAEGVATATAAVKMGDEAGVEMPICTAVADLVSGARTLRDIVDDLLARPFKTEGI